jgi:hypothetical protein
MIPERSIVLDGHDISYAVTDVRSTRGPRDTCSQITLTLLGTTRITRDADGVSITWEITTLKQPN